MKVGLHTRHCRGMRHETDAVVGDMSDSRIRERGGGTARNAHHRRQRTDNLTSAKSNGDRRSTTANAKGPPHRRLHRHSTHLRRDPCNGVPCLEQQRLYQRQKMLPTKRLFSCRGIVVVACENRDRHACSGRDGACHGRPFQLSSSRKNYGTDVSI